jgi:ATP-dependent RNA helicase DeaD
VRQAPPRQPDAARAGDAARRDKREDRSEHAAPPAASGEWASLYISIGFQAGLRPGDLVGAIANETGISGRAIGAIDIRERFSFFQVAAEHANHVLNVMGESSIRGRRVSVRPARPAPRGPVGGPRDQRRPGPRGGGYERPKRK